MNRAGLDRLVSNTIRDYTLRLLTAVDTRNLDATYHSTTSLFTRERDIHNLPVHEVAYM